MQSQDELFSLYYFRRLHEETFNSEDSNQDVIAYIESNKYTADAKKWDELATRAQLSFWDQLMESEPDLLRLAALAGQINTSVVAAQDAYRRLIRLQTTPSPDVLRMFGVFVRGVGRVRV